MKQMTLEETRSKIQELINEENLDEARSLMDKLKKEQDEEKAKSAKADKEEEPKEEEPKEEAKAEDKPKEEPKEEEPKEEEPKKEEPKKEKSEKRSMEQEGEPTMEKTILNGAEVAPTEQENEVRGFMQYIKSKDLSTRAFDTTGVKSVDAQAIIPKEIITKAKMLPETVVDLRNNVTVQKVSHAQGSYPILESNQAVLASVEELKANPDLEKPQFKDVDYKVLTYRGQLAVAQEALDDSDDDLAGIIARHIQRQGLNTANKAIAGQLKTATAVAATSLDDIKTQINTGFDPAYNLEFLVSQSFFNAVDQMKDGNGNYLLQPDVTAQSGKQLFGRPITILADTLIGTVVGDKVAFLGEPSAFAVYFDRVQTSVRWVEEVYYGQVLAVAMRFDTKVVDPKAGKYITLTPAP